LSPTLPEDRLKTAALQLDLRSPGDRDLALRTAPRRPHK
jgi:hypothetical protein